jgi:primosomal replication protein N
MPGLKKEKVFGKLLWLFCLSLFFFGACQSEEPQARTGKIQKPATLTLMVNQARAAQIAGGLPIIVSGFLENKDSKKGLVLEDISRWQVKVFSRDKGNDLSIAWHELKKEEVTLPAGEVLRLAWVLKTSLAPGFYTITVTGVGPGIRVKPAFVEMSEKKAPEKEIARARRRVMALRGETQNWLLAVEQALAKDPKSHSLGYERVQAYAANQDYAKAHKALAGLIRQVELKGAKSSGNSSPHLPSWYYAELSWLKKAATQSR